ncbi:transcriptional regulator [Maribrevibacterium harenarium]|uniref:Transcriptional regulator n=1 Tax=Maribrevibacterium harenarium TaxID=2589817 RepID=A0A501WSS1_9GAMM|nr:HlyU family transcriptional regulator [Maribrevibacterium harenarium]TPE50327.1 transcriptional regulator [Maribrevibacterium harenarium]
MGLLSSISKLFSGGQESANQPSVEAVEYQGFLIQPAPMKDQGQYRVAATITKGEGENLREHKFIRSDLLGSFDECVELTVRKAKLTIDQLGDNIF